MLNMIFELRPWFPKSHVVPFLSFGTAYALWRGPDGSGPSKKGPSQ